MSTSDRGAKGRTGGVALAASLLAVVVLGATAAPTSADPPARPFAGKVEPRAGQLYWGVFQPGLPGLRFPVIRLEQKVDRRPAIAMWYSAWAGTPAFPRAQVDWLRRRGIVPMLTWEPWRPPKRAGGRIDVTQPSYRYSRIAAGRFDRYLRRYARAVRAYRGPLMLRPFHEMDGFWYPWGGVVNGNTPRDFVNAWRHMHRLFTAEGATNVTWVWSVNALSVPQTRRNSIRNYWPGARYVDWIGISGFNWGTSSSFGTWSSFGQIYNDRIRSLRPYRKPIVLTEIGAAEVGGDKAAWIRTTFASILRDYPRIRGFIWYDKRDTRLRDWRIGSSRAATEAFARVVAGKRVLSAPAALASAR